MSLETILASITDEEARGQLSGVAEKFPQVKQYVELGERFSSVATRMGPRFEETFTKLSTIEPAKAAEDLARLPEWVDYHNRNWDDGRKMYKTQAAAVDELEQAKARIRELEAKGDSEMTLDEIKAGLKADPSFSAVDTSKYVTKEEMLGSLNLQAQRFQNVYVALTPKIGEHERTFGEALPMERVMDVMAKKPNLTPTEAYDEVMAPKRREVESANHKKEVDQARKEGEAAGRTAAMQEHGKPGIPVSSGGSARGVPHFMAKIFSKREDRMKNAGAGRLGDGTATREGMQKYLEKQMGGGSV